MDSSDSDARSSGSEFHLSSASNSESEDHSDNDASNSDDFNPFDDDSDSDADPWVKKRKTAKKKPDKLEKHLKAKVKQSAQVQSLIFEHGADLNSGFFISLLWQQLPHHLETPSNVLVQ